MTSRAPWIFAPLVLLAPPLAWSEVYKWVDDKGVVNYSSTPPAGKAAKQLPTDAPGVTVVPGTPLPPPAPAKSKTEERVEKLEKALEAEKASRESEAQREVDRRKAAVAECEANRGIDCEQDPYQALNRSYVLPGRVIHPNRPDYYPPRPPPPPPPPKPTPPKERPASGVLKPFGQTDEKK